MPRVRLPEDDPESAQVEKVRYATPEKLRRPLKWIDSNDRGWLEISPDKLFFSGRSTNVAIGEVLSVSLVRDRGPLVLAAIYAGLWLAVLAYGVYSGTSGRS